MGKRWEEEEKKEKGVWRERKYMYKKEARKKEKM
jgi:hypothetical protein